MFSLCSECLFCKCSGGGCLAGNGDDDFVPMDIAEIKQMVESGFHMRYGRKLSGQEIKRLQNIIDNGYSRTSYKTVVEKIY